MTTRYPWIVWGSFAVIGMVVITITGAFVGISYLRMGDQSFGISDPGRIDPPATTVALGTNQIEGLVWHDLCASSGLDQQGSTSVPAGCVQTATGGFLADGRYEAGEFGIAGVTVLLGQGDCPSDGFTATTTNAEGSFGFQHLVDGEYCVTVDPLLGSNASILLPGSWSSTLGSSLAMKSVRLENGQVESEVAFGWDYEFLPIPPTATVTPTSSPTPTLTPTLTSTPAPLIPCDIVGFIKDVTVPDGTTFGPDEDFRKTWRLKNIGTCTWTKDYDLVFVGGNRMTGDNVTPLKTNVKPGETIDISIELTAPLQVGKHTGYWALRNASGKVFGMGPKAGDAFWVVVSVEKRVQLKLNHDFASNYCQATWVSAAGLIDCPTESYDVSGFIQRLDAPVMEGGRVENEHGLWVIPEGVAGGYLSGTFPPFKVESGDRFRTVVACLEDYEECAVEFRLEYRIGDGEVKTLGKWQETYEGKFTKVDIDLTPLAGKEVQFILTILAGESFNEDSGLWLRPSIWRQ